MEDKYVYVGGYYIYYKDNAYYGADYLQNRIDSNESTAIIKATIDAMKYKNKGFDFEDQNGKNYTLTYDQTNYKFYITLRN